MGKDHLRGCSLTTRPADGDSPIELLWTHVLNFSATMLNFKHMKGTGQ